MDVNILSTSNNGKTWNDKTPTASALDCAITGEVTLEVVELVDTEAERPECD